MAATGHDERTRWCASGYGAKRRGNARECSSSQCWERAWEFVHSPLVRAFLVSRNHKLCAIVCLPADRTTHACPTQTCVRGTKLTRRGVSRSAAVATVPPKQNKHDLGLPTHNVFATVRVLDDRLLFGILFGIRAIRSVVTTSEALGQLCSACLGRTLSSLGQPHCTTGWWNTDLLGPRSGSGVLLLFLLIQTSTHHSLPQQHRLADDQPAAARHELSEHRLLSSRRGGAQITRTRVHVYSSTYSST